MLQKIVVSLFLVGVGFLILIVSILRSVSIRYVFELSRNESAEMGRVETVDYSLPYPGRVWPGSVLWPLKAFRDKVWVWVNPGYLEKADILLLLSDKRLILGWKIIEKGDSELGVSVLVKSEIYLNRSFEMSQKAQKSGLNVSEFLGRLSLASLKHREVLETIYDQVPEDGRPVVSKIIGESMKVYEESKQSLHEIGREAAENPFD
jgi:hypothetical protein